MTWIVLKFAQCAYLEFCFQCFYGKRNLPCVLHVLITQKLTPRTFKTMSTRLSRHDSEVLVKFALCDARFFFKYMYQNHIIVHVKYRTRK